MSGKLRLWIEIDDGGDCELFSEFEKDGFSGRGHAGFSIASLTKCAEEFAQYPIFEQFPCIEGGYWSSSSKKIIQEHLHISVYPTDSRGHLSLRVRGAEPHDDLNRLEPRYSASVEFVTSYEQMAKFSRDLISLAHGNMAEIVVDEIVG